MRRAARLRMRLLLCFFTRLRLRALKTTAARGHLYAGGRFGARRRPGAAEEVRFGVRRAPGGAPTPENSAESTGKLPQRNLRGFEGKSKAEGWLRGARRQSGCAGALLGA